MTRRPNRAAPLGAALLVAFAAACADTAPTAGTAAREGTLPEAPSGAHIPTTRLTIYGLDDRNTLVTFSADEPNRAARRVAITGVTGSLIGLDVRPNDQGTDALNLAGRLYAVSSTGAVYTVDSETGVATLRSTLNVPLAGANFGVGFNPMVDRLRFHSETGQNLRANVENGVTLVDTPLAYASGDANFGKTPTVVATGYTNSVNPAPPKVELYAIDAEQDVLVELDAPNNGQLTTVGRLVVNNGTQVGFDIPGRATDRTGYATFTPPRGQRSFLYRVNLDDARRTPVGPVDHMRPIISIAIDDAGATPSSTVR